MSDDFFSNVPVRRGPAHSPATVTDVHDDFAHAISLRFGSADIRTARLLPGDLPNRQPPNPTHTPAPPNPALPSRPAPLQSFSSVSPSALAPYLADPCTLVLDIRPHAAHSAARVIHALSLSVPTTLLKRPLFSLSKLSQMLPSPSSRARFADWPSASAILVYDSDSASSPDHSIIAGLLRKFRAEGFLGELGWIHGGFQAVWRETRHLTTTEQPSQEEDDPEGTSSSGTLRTTHLPRAAFSLFSTTAAPNPQFGVFPPSLPLPNTPAPSASRAANPFFDAIRQNLELSHGITERIPLCLPRRVRRRIHDLPFRWLQDIARRSALRHSSAFRHPGLESFESGSESSDDPHTSDPDENDPNVEEGTETLAMQFYRIELAEQRRLRSIMEHHTKESEVSGLAPSPKLRRGLDRGGAGLGTDRGQAGVFVRSGSKSVPGTPHPNPFPYSITAGVEKGAKNRYTHIWPFEHARVRLHDSRHQGSHPGRRDKGKASDLVRSARDRSEAQGKESEEHAPEHDWTQPSPISDRSQGQEAAEKAGSFKHSFYFELRSPVGSTIGSEDGLARPTSIPNPSVPRVKIDYDVADQDTRMSGPPTPATALPLLTPPFYTPMEIPSAYTPMRSWPTQLLSLSSGVVNPEGRLGGAQFVISTSSLPSPGQLVSPPLRLPTRSGGLLPSIGEQVWSSESQLSSTAPPTFSSEPETFWEAGNDAVVKRDPRREPSPGDDYVNASYVQPLGTRKRYIATQGPLPSTYVDFWTLVWEQNVHVIVMLTREVENAMVKCGSYWTDTEYGPLRLELLSTSPPMSPSDNPASADISKQGFFTIREPQGGARGTSKDQPTLITRTFSLNHTSYPGVPPRKVTHFQYLDWSDMNVPDDPRGVLDLVRRVEQTVAESTPGPSPSGSLSPGSGSGSPSGSPLPEVEPDQRGHNKSLLSPTSAGIMPGGGKRRRGSEWRHPELDSKTGVAAFALGKTAPVLLHCSAGVGRTGGFIAVDAVLDGIRRELRRDIEEQKLRKLNAATSAEGKVYVNDGEGSGEISVESTEAGINSLESGREESASDGNERMDVDESTTGDAEKTRDPPPLMNTVPIHVSAGDRTKGNRRHRRGKDLTEKKRSSSESLVVHVPYAGTDVPVGTTAGIDLDDPKEAGWHTSSTRQWVKQVSDQTHANADEGDLPPPSHPPPSRERSPGSSSNSSAPSVLNSADESMSGSGSTNAGGGGVGNKGKSKSNTGSASGSGSGSGSRGPRLSLGSKPGSGSISVSNSGSGTGTGSRFGSSLLHARLRDSSVTSVSAGSSDSLLHERKANVPLHRPSAIRTRSSSDMEVDYPRPVSVPLQPVQSNTASLQSTVHSRYHNPVFGSSPVASISSPVLLTGTAQRGTPFGNSAESPVSRPRSELGSDIDLASLPQDENGGSIDAEERGRNSQIASDVFEELISHTKPGNNLRLDTELGSLKVPEALLSSGSAKNPHLPSGETKGKERVSVPLESGAGLLGNMGLRQSLANTGALGASALEERAADHPVIDYKLPRELHSDLSPPLISSFAEPICMIIQDMREQRMSLCQSLRQYVFVHAAVIEGALRIVDEEHELWGYSGTSDDASSSAEGESGTSFRKGERRSSHNERPKVQFVRTAKMEAAVLTPDVEHRSRLLHTGAQPPNQWGLEGNMGVNHVQIAAASSTSGVSSPSKGKRGPSPTELLREDKTGALSSNKRPSIHRKTRNDGGPFPLELNSPLPVPVAGESGGGSRDTTVSVSGPRAGLGRPAVPEKEAPASGTAT